jgi:DNA-binding response OmpR family regulator
MKKKILLADDDESVRKMVSRVLESAGYTVTLAGTGEQAAAQFRAERPDLVVWDLEMPALAGQEGLGLEGPADEPVPVIATTVWPKAQAKTVPRGISTLLEKPLDLALLLKTIQELLTRREQPSAHRLASAA